MYQVISNDMANSNRLVILDIDKVKFCPYCGHLVKVEYSRDNAILSVYKTCNVADCDFKMVIT